ncbi:MAG: aldehyde dehydrogenase family protein, partial [Candidatus Limnocylindrus sp.]
MGKKGGKKRELRGSPLLGAVAVPDDARLEVRRTPKLYIGGAFPRSESGRTDVLPLARGGSLNIARASRKDLREAVKVARSAAPAWASRNASLRGQIMYRVAELMEGRAAQFRNDL